MTPIVWVEGSPNTFGGLRGTEPRAFKIQPSDVLLSQLQEVLRTMDSYPEN